MKKKVLFVMNDMRCGGAEKALVSLLQTINYDLYEVDLQLFRKEGLFLKQVHENVNILPEIEVYKTFDGSFLKAIFKSLMKADFKTIFNRIKTAYITKTERNKAICEQKCWEAMQSSFPTLNKKYDVAIGFLEKRPGYFVVDKVDANVKIAFVHNDYNKLGMSPDFDLPYFKKIDNIIADSDECIDILKQNFPTEAQKFVLMHCIVSPNLIHKLALESIEAYPKKLNIVSIGRFDPQKGYDFAIDALKIVKEKGYNFHWTILGAGALKNQMIEQIQKNGIAENVSMIGIKENHYPYVKQADIFMQTSRFEGKSIAIDEAKILCKPILVTNFSTVNDQIEHLKTGYIAEMNPESIAEGLIKMFENKDLCEELSSNLKQLDLGTEHEVEKLYQLFC